MEIIKNTKMEELGNYLINQIKNIKYPFLTPYIIFPNNKMEQWFKKYWLKKENTVLMNIKCLRMLPFILSMFKSKSEIFSSSNLKDIIICYVLGHKNVLSKKNYDYIFNKDEEIKVNNLYDFASTLAKLLIEYDSDKFIIPDSDEKIIYEGIKKEYSSKYLSLKDAYIKNANSIEKISSPIFFFGITQIGNLYKDIIETIAKNNKVTILQLDDLNDDYRNKDFVISSAPSINREVENVHSQICNLLKEGVDFKDILVVAPNINDYLSSIGKTFNQFEKEGYINIPYVILSKNKLESNVYSSLKLLVDILEKGFFTRKDYFALITNKVIQKVRGISDDYVNVIMSSLINVNAYDNMQENEDDWSYSINRMLLTKLIGYDSSYENKVTLNDNKDYLPYYSIDLEEQYICIHIQIINDLKSFISRLKDKKTIDNETIDILKEELDKWYSLKQDEDDIENNFFYGKILEKLDFWKSINKNNVPLKELFLSLLDETQSIFSASGELFTSGITFMNFDPSVILSIDYLFFMGLSSNNFPRVNSKSELDLRNYFIDITEKDRLAFKYYLNNVNKKVYLSYVNFDLKKDEEFFPSSSILEIAKLKEILDNNKVVNITLDETRNWNELFTRYEIAKKEAYINLMNSKTYIDNAKKVIPSNIDNAPRKVSISNIEKYLQEPFSYKANVLFGSNDNNQEKYIIQHQPLLVDSLDKANINKIIVQYLLNNHLESVSIEDSKNIINKFKINHILPSSYLGDKFVQSQCEMALEFILNVKEILKDLSMDLSDCHLEDLEDLFIELDQNKCTSFSISSKNNNIIYAFSNNKLFCIKCNINGNDAKITDYLKAYVFSLYFVASLNSNNDIHVYNYAKKDKKHEFIINSTKAKEILRQIYLDMNDYTSLKIIPLESIENYLSSKEKIDDSNANSLLEKINDSLEQEHSSWSYFNWSKLFDISIDNGYNHDENLANEFNNELQRIKKAIVFLNEEDNKDE